MEGRDSKGRFIKGNKSLGGRKPRTEEQEIIAALDGEIPLSEVLERLHQAISGGKDWAIKLYLAYYWHLPTQPVKGDIDIKDNLKISVKLKDGGD